MINKLELTEKISKAIKEMRSSHDNGTYYWYLGQDDNNNDWAIVLGWQDGYEEDDTDDDLNKHNILKIKERCQITYTNKMKLGLTTKEIAERLNKTEDEVKALFSYFDTLSIFSSSFSKFAKVSK